MKASVSHMFAKQASGPKYRKVRKGGLNICALGMFRKRICYINELQDGLPQEKVDKLTQLSVSFNSLGCQQENYHIPLISFSLKLFIHFFLQSKSFKKAKSMNRCLKGNNQFFSEKTEQGTRGRHSTKKKKKDCSFKWHFKI